MDEMFDELETDKEGEISYEEFLSLFDQRMVEEMQQSLDKIMDESEHEGDEDLVDENAVIPGGRHESMKDLLISGEED